MNKTTKKYVISSLLTFATGFALVILPVIDSITLESVQSGAIVGVLFVALRAGFKALLEMFVQKA